MLGDDENENDDDADEHDAVMYSDLLKQLQPTQIEIGNKTLELLALPESIFHRVTTLSKTTTTTTTVATTTTTGGTQKNRNGHDKDDQADINDKQTADTEILDGTGTRPYSSSKAFLYFLETFFEDIFVVAEEEAEEDGVIKGSSVIELGAGIGACSLYLFQLLLHHQHCYSVQRRDHSILVTDGEALTVEILKRNVEKQCFVVHRHRGDNDDDDQDNKINKATTTTPRVVVQKLQWSKDMDYIAQQLLGNSKKYSLHSFDFVIGTDLLYYKTDADELIATIHALLCHDKPGLVFLPGLIRSSDLPDRLIVACQQFDLELMVLDLTKFITQEQDLAGVAGWYNIHFFVLKRTTIRLPQAWQCALDRAGQQPFCGSQDSDPEEEQMRFWSLEEHT